MAAWSRDDADTYFFNPCGMAGHGIKDTAEWLAKANSKVEFVACTGTLSPPQTSLLTKCAGGVGRPRPTPASHVMAPSPTARSAHRNPLAPNGIPDYLAENSEFLKFDMVGSSKREQDNLC